MCVDSAVKPDDLQGPVGLWPCHNQGGNQVFQFEKFEIFILLTIMYISIFIHHNNVHTCLHYLDCLGYRKRVSLVIEPKSFFISQIGLF